MRAENTISTITIEAPARLHLGFLDLNGNLGRRFGSIGMAIDNPVTSVKVTRSNEDSSSGPEAQRALLALRKLKTTLKIDGNFDVTVKSAIPPHAGLGSGTQLALAIGAGLTALENVARTNEELGELLSRGARSAIGIAAFTKGGFIIDGGKGKSTAPPPVIANVAFPDEWRVLLVFDKNAIGVHGDIENEAFDNLPPMPRDNVGDICRQTLMRLLPALIEKKIEPFGDALTQIQKYVGAHFAAAQGGEIWTSPAVAQICARAAGLGAHGIGQSSWGPTGFAFVESQNAAESLYHSLVEEAKALDLDIAIARGRNRGAKLAPSAGAEKTPRTAAKHQIT